MASAEPQVRCTVTDPRLTELSGMAVGSGGLWAMSDGGRRVEVHRLDPETCRIVNTRTAPIDPFDAEDLALGPDQELWVSDTGDNGRQRDTVALIALPRAGAARLYRLTYPDGPHDAEALLVGTDGVPLVITKEPGRAAGIYRPARTLRAGDPTPLDRVGEVGLPVSGTVGGPLGGLGSRLVTGAALSTDGRTAALRTYTDAWLYPVAGPAGTAAALVAALAEPPVQVPLPDEPQGEAVAFTPDGTLLSGSESRGGVRGQLRAVPGAAALATGLSMAPPVQGGPMPASDDAPAWPAVTAVAATAGLLGLLVVAMAAHGRRRARRR